MIRSEKEYKETQRLQAEQRERIEQMRRSLFKEGLTSEQVERAIEPLLTFHLQLQEELDAYEDWKRGNFKHIQGLEDIGVLLIAVRVYLDLTQRELAEKLGVSESQVSRDERNEYHGITVERAGRILDAMGAQVTMDIKLPEPAALASA